MLFTYDAPSNGGYWMFNTYVPLDILYISATGAVLDSATMAPCPRRIAQQEENTNDWRDRCGQDARAYAPDASYIATLELPAGWLEDAGLGGRDAPGLTVTWPAR
jgi:hypothetical protein